MANLSGSEFTNKPLDFKAPTQLPSSDAQRGHWQAANKAWWETSPMRYDWRDELALKPGSEAYFEEIDRRFFASATSYTQWQDRPFESLIPFQRLIDKDVLEIGVGLGTHAQLLSASCNSFTGIDLTSFAAQMTAKRLQIFNLKGEVLQMDAERMAFGDASFDYIWSWGVIHHSADTWRILAEMNRVLRPGGTASVMVYHRSWWTYPLRGILKGIFQGGLRTHGSIHAVNQGGTDGAIARFYTEQEWRDLVKDLFIVDSVEICGPKIDLLPLPHGRLKKLFARSVPDFVSRVLTHRLRFGTFLVAHMHKRQLATR